MSWENQQIAGPSSFNGLAFSEPHTQTDAERIDILTKELKQLKDQVENGSSRKIPRARKATLVSIDAKIVSIEAKIDLILNILNQHS